MELGGNAPFIVFDDADLEAALDGVMIAKMRNAGEACTAANRFYVQSGIHDAFVAGLTRRMAALKIGPGYDPATQCGPMITTNAVRKIDRLVSEAIAGGARATTGGKPLEDGGYFYPPTVLENVPVDASIAREEIFGPVAPVYRFDSDEEAIRLANDTEYGLAAYIYSRDLKRALQVGKRLETGMLGINRGLMSDPAAPFGGVKQSGLGREGGVTGILEFMEPKYYAVDY
jgi:succinate-semialdehyde dehydrogenase/glutarate-semialdehyde dehydrogenase